MTETETAIRERLEGIETILDKLNNQVSHLKRTLIQAKEEDAKSSCLDIAKGEAALAYCMETVFLLCLRIKGYDVDHPIHKDLPRLKSYVGKIQNIEHAGEHKRQKRINVEAASRFIKNSL